MIEPTIPDITSDDLDLLRAIHHESQQSHRGVTAEMCCVLSNCDTPAQREALVARINRLIAAPLRLLRMDPNDPERVCLSVDGRQVLQAAPSAANEASPGDVPTTEASDAAVAPSASTEDDDMAKPLNALQQAVIDTLSDEDAVHAETSLTTQELITALRRVPGHEDVTGQSLGPCLAGLDRRGLTWRYYHGAGISRVMRWYLTEQGQQAATPRDAPSHCNACGSLGGEFHAPECPAVDAFTAGRVAGAVEDRPDDAEPGEQAATPPATRRHCFSFCHRCGYNYPLPGEYGPTNGLCDYCRVSYSQQPETLVEGSGPSRVEVTPLQVAIHPAGTHYLHPASILLSVENDGEGDYLTIKNIGGGLAIEIEDMATLDAVRIQAERLLAQAQREDEV